MVGAQLSNYDKLDEQIIKRSHYQWKVSET